mmetsp:Transcript_3045/g.7263  ORF Transcript_3045/g.7263 Transcript_3045/m.7263 type:complete len:153 (+) Transcript_3045:181-639(+)
MLRAFARVWGHRTVRTEITIDAEAAEVWAVLVDTSSYPAWNRTLIRVEGTMGPGAVLDNTVVDGKGKESQMKSTVVDWVPCEELHQHGGLPGLLTFDHRWLLRPGQLATGGRGTNVVQTEEYGCTLALACASGTRLGSSPRTPALMWTSKIA